MPVFKSSFYDLEMKLNEIILGKKLPRITIKFSFTLPIAPNCRLMNNLISLSSSVAPTTCEDAANPNTPCGSSLPLIEIEQILACGSNAAVPVTGIPKKRRCG